jgi:hypothetical protein
MFFLFRALFWLAVVAMLMPAKARPPAAEAQPHLAAAAAGTVAELCVSHAEACLNAAMAARNLVAQSVAEPRRPVTPVTPVPLPVARPKPLGRG